MVKCKACGTEFASPIQFDRGSFERPDVQMDSNSYQCPNGHSKSYNKADHFFR
jgi:hypothetical protein